MSRKCKRIHWSEASAVVRQAAFSTAPPGHVLPRSWFRRIADFDLWFVCSGRAELTDENGAKTVLSRGSVACIAPGDDFELRVDSSGPYTNAFVHFDLLDGSGQRLLRDQVEMPPATGSVHDAHFFESCLQRITFLQYHYEKRDPQTVTAVGTQTSHMLKSLLYDYQLANTDIAIGAGIQKHHRQMVSSALSRIYLHPKSALSASRLAKEFGHSQHNFCRIFRLVTGKTPGQTLIEARIDHAKKLLATTSMNITEIAGSLSYESVFYFSKQFKKVTGLAPTGFRASLLSK